MPPLMHCGFDLPRVEIIDRNSNAAHKTGDAVKEGTKKTDDKTKEAADKTKDAVSK